jgi:hypothetical protein
MEVTGTSEFDALKALVERLQTTLAEHEGRINELEEKIAALPDAPGGV